MSWHPTVEHPRVRGGAPYALAELCPEADAAYNLPAAVRMTGVLDRRALALAADDLVARHQALRTTLSSPPGGIIAELAPAQKASCASSTSAEASRRNSRHCAPQRTRLPSLSLSPGHRCCAPRCTASAPRNTYCPSSSTTARATAGPSTTRSCPIVVGERGLVGRAVMPFSRQIRSNSSSAGTAWCTCR